LLVVYGAVGFFFLMRFARTLKGPSLLLALSAPLGWCFVAVLDLGLLTFHPWAPIRWVGAALGIALLAAVARWDRIDPKGREQRPSAEYDRD
jgi:hypothetical protein